MSATLVAQIWAGLSITEFNAARVCGCGRVIRCKMCYYPDVLQQSIGCVDAQVRLEVVCNLRCMGWLACSKSLRGGWCKIRVRAVKYRLGQGRGDITAQMQVIKVMPKPKFFFFFSNMLACAIYFDVNWNYCGKWKILSNPFRNLNRLLFEL